MHRQTGKGAEHSGDTERGCTSVAAEGEHGGRSILATAVSLILYGWTFLAYEAHLSTVQFHHQ